MCTVTFLPLGSNEFVLTSNRDVSYKRPVASPPEYHLEKGVKLLYPRDGKAGGTWIGSSRDNRLICLLNGGFRDHRRQEVYRKSRGLAAENLSDSLSCIDLQGIEPFTLVLVEWEESLCLREFVWDGSLKHLKDLPLEPRIWSSSTLFDKNMRDLRREWFDSWKNESVLSPAAILNFHKKAGEGDKQVAVVLRREHVGTVSITQFVKRKDVRVAYEALQVPH